MKTNNNYLFVFIKRHIVSIIFLETLLLSVACSDKKNDHDATGTFEATETTVSAEHSGSLLIFNVNEGESLSVGSEVGLIDTVQIRLKIQQALATKTVYQSQKPNMDKQIAAIRQQLTKAEAEQRRYQALVNDGAAPRKMLDDAKNQVQVLKKQLEAQISSISTQVATINSQTSTVDVQVKQLTDELKRCHITVPTSGVVLEKYVERGEFVNTGKPLFKMADTDMMFLRAYVTSAQLQDIRIGQKVKVFASYGADRKKEYAGTVTWISSHSEFTPKTIVTDDERADLVYAVKIAVRNDGFIKIGMYGEVLF